MLMKEEGAPKNTRMFLKTTGIFPNNKEMFFKNHRYCMLLKEYMRVQKCENDFKKTEGRSYNVYSLHENVGLCRKQD